MSETKPRVLAPGIWVDGDGSMHISVPDVLASLGIEDSAMNRDMVEAAAMAVMSDWFPDIEFIHRDTGQEN